MPCGVGQTSLERELGLLNSGNGEALVPLLVNVAIFEAEDGATHHIDVRRLQGTQWRFQYFYTW